MTFCAPDSLKSFLFLQDVLMAKPLIPRTQKCSTCVFLFQHESHRKPQGLIILEDSCRISRGEGSNTFEITVVESSTMTSSSFDAAGSTLRKRKTYHLMADTAPLMEDWVRVLQAVVQRNALQTLLKKYREDSHENARLQGWLTKVKHGHSKKLWCILLGKMFVYFKSPGMFY